MTPTLGVRRTADEALPILLASHPYRFFGSFRLLLALLVLTSHSSSFLGQDVAGLSLGNVGVFMFFVVSGTVICEALDIFYRQSVGRFLINRFLKIFPAYWAVTALYYIGFAIISPDRIHADAWPIVVNLSLLLGYLRAGNNEILISVGWAVLVEFQFYILVAALFFVARRTRSPGTVLYLGAVAALGLYVFVHLTGGYLRFYGAFRFAPYFVLGAAIYYAYSRADWRAAALIVPAAILSVHSYLVYALATPAGGLPLTTSAYAGNQIASTVLFVAGAVVFGMLFPRRFPGGMEWLDKRLGDITYALYLVHPLFIAIAVYLGLEARFGSGSAYLFVLGLSLLTATAIFRGIERPVMRLRNLFRGRRLYD